jgi:hypothetical protein
MLDAIDLIEQYSHVDREQFMLEPMRYDAVIRRLQIIGEATKNLSTGLRERSPPGTACSGCSRRRCPSALLAGAVLSAHHDSCGDGRAWVCHPTVMLGS